MGAGHAEAKPEHIVELVTVDAHRHRTTEVRVGKPAAYFLVEVEVHVELQCDIASDLLRV